jgi:hypothetical protein
MFKNKLEYISNLILKIEYMIFKGRFDAGDS